VLLAVALVRNADEQLAGISALYFGLGVMLLGVGAYAATRRFARVR
jgi:hypothetical protein